MLNRPNLIFPSQGDQTNISFKHRAIAWTNFYLDP